MGTELEFQVIAPDSGFINHEKFLLLMGTCPPGCQVEARGNSTVADASGRWALSLNAPRNPGNYNLTVIAKHGNLAGTVQIPFVQQSPENRDTLLEHSGKIHAAPELKKNNILPMQKPSLVLRATIFPPQGDGFSELQVQNYARELARFLHPENSLEFHLLAPDSLRAPNPLYRVGGCRDFECALQLGRLNSLDFVVVGRLKKQGIGYRMEWNAISVLQGATLGSTRQDLGANLAELEKAMQAAGRELSSVVTKTALGQGDTGADTGRELHSGTPLHGSIISGVLSAKASPYLVSGTLSVPANEVLIIEPGVTLYFKPGQYAGIQVFGQILARGTTNRPIRFLSAARQPNAWDWNRILILGSARSEFSNVIIGHANFGLHVENSSLLLKSSTLENNSLRGVFVRNSEALIQDSKIGPEHIVGVQASAYGKVVLVRSTIEGNRNGLAVSKLGQMEIRNSHIWKNDRGIILAENSALVTEKSRIEQNQVGIATIEPLRENIFEGLRGNLSDIVQIRSGFFERIMEDPDAPFADRRPLDLQDLKAMPASGELREKDTWTSFGNLQAGAQYHRVQMASNPGPLQDEDINGVVQPGERYANIFSEPGLRMQYNMFLLMESNSGKVVEFSMDGSSSAWNRFYGHPWRMRLANRRQGLVLGNFYEGSNALVFSGLNLFGAKYHLDLGKNNAQQELLRLEIFGGESRRPLAVGERNPEIFADLPQENFAISQNVLAAWRLILKPSDRLNFTTGWLGSRDRTQKLGLFRTDITQGQSTRDPLQETRTVYLSSDWQNKNRSTDLRLTLALGLADTADVYMQAAIDRTWAQAGHASPAMSSMRRVLEVPGYLATMDSVALVALLPGSESLNTTQLRDSLLVLQDLALNARDSMQRAAKENRIFGYNANARNLAASLEWRRQFALGLLRASARFVGDRYFSQGAASLLQNSRIYEWGWSQALFPWWDLEFGYSLMVENASDKTKDGLNVLGFGEGSRWGLRPNASWHEFHLDSVRARRVQKVFMEQNWRAGTQLDLQFIYGVEHRDAFTNTWLRRDFSPLSAVFLDPWFAPRATGFATSTLQTATGDTVQVDSARWSQLAISGGNDTLAKGFREVEWLQNASFHVGWRRPNIAMRLGVEGSLLSDASRFTKNSLIQDMDLQDSTWGKLGYEFGRRSYWEAGLPMVATLRIGALGSRTTFRPRWRDYSGSENRQKFEWNLAERLDIPLYRRKLSLGISGEIRRQNHEQVVQKFALQDSVGSQFQFYRLNEQGNIVVENIPQYDSYEVSGTEDGMGIYSLVRHREKLQWTDWDFIWEGSLRFNFSSRTYSELRLRLEDYRRPLQPFQSYRDKMGGVTLYSSF